MDMGILVVETPNKDINTQYVSLLPLPRVVDFADQQLLSLQETGTMVLFGNATVCFGEQQRECTGVFVNKEQDELLSLCSFVKPRQQGTEALFELLDTFDQSNVYRGQEGAVVHVASIKGSIVMFTHKNCSADYGWNNSLAFDVMLTSEIPRERFEILFETPEAQQWTHSFIVSEPRLHLAQHEFCSNPENVRVFYVGSTNRLTGHHQHLYMFPLYSQLLILNKQSVHAALRNHYIVFVNKERSEIIPVDSKEYAWRNKLRNNDPNLLRRFLTAGYDCFFPRDAPQKAETYLSQYGWHLPGSFAESTFEQRYENTRHALQKAVPPLDIDKVLDAFYECLQVRCDLARFIHEIPLDELVEPNAPIEFGLRRMQQIKAYTANQQLPSTLKRVYGCLNREQPFSLWKMVLTLQQLLNTANALSAIENAAAPKKIVPIIDPKTMLPIVM